MILKFFLRYQHNYEYSRTWVPNIGGLPRYQHRFHIEKRSGACLRDFKSNSWTKIKSSKKRNLNQIVK
jgi:hypothetical protein